MVLSRFVVGIDLGTTNSALAYVDTGAEGDPVVQHLQILEKMPWVSRGGYKLAAAIDHWINKGLPDEGRRGSLEFDVRYYLGHYPDLKAAFGTNYVAAVDHWINQGLPNEGRRGSTTFDVQYYLSRYADLSAAFGPKNYVAAIDHWINQGFPNEHREGAARPLPPGPPHH